MSQHYSDPSRESDPYALPDVVVFYADEGDLQIEGYACHSPPEENEEPSPAGWYYWFCFPGCMPDSDPIGPFATEREAVRAMRDQEC